MFVKLKKTKLVALINTGNKYLNSLIGISIFILILTIIEHFNNEKIENNGGYNIEVIAIITNKSNYNKKRNSIYFEYQFQNIGYSGYEKNLSDESYQTLSVGDDIRVFINDKYPTYTKLDL